MKKNAVALPFAVGAFLLAAGCGDDVTKTTVVEDTGIAQLAKGDTLPECTKENAGEMLYAADSGKAYICTGKAWTPLTGESSADTVVLSNVDTVVVRDTLLQKDSVFLSQIDTVVLKDTLILSNVDTLIIRDTLVGLNGESCTAEMLEDSSGYKIVCGTDSVGVVLNGFDGTNGINGEKGEKGDDGESCTVADSGNGIVYVQCESDTVALYKAVCGTTPYDPEKSFCDSRDGTVYNFVVIGSQTWMAQNLNYAYNEGTATSYCYSDDTSNCTKYGRLYTWSAAMDSAAVFSANGSGCGYGKTCTTTEPVRGVCPAGWHLPTNAEFETLIAAVGGDEVAGKKLKSGSGWEDDGNGTDDYGFSALSAGYRFSVGDFYDAGSYAYFWSATEGGTYYARYMNLVYNYDGALLSYGSKDFAFSVRCLKD